MSTFKYKNTTISLIGIFLIILPISPISSQPIIIEKPDLLLCLMFSWLILDPKKVSLSILIFLSLFADILWYRPLGLWPVLILIGSLSIRYMLTKISLDSYFFKMIYFILFLLTIDSCIFLTSLIGLTKQLDFDIWINRFILTILSFPLIYYLLEILLFKDIKKSNSKIY